MRALAIVLALLVLAPTCLAATAALDVPRVKTTTPPAKAKHERAPAAPPPRPQPVAESRAPAPPLPPQAARVNEVIEQAAPPVVELVESVRALPALRRMVDPHGAKVERIERALAMQGAAPTSQTRPGWQAPVGDPPRGPEPGGAPDAPPTQGPGPRASTPALHVEERATRTRAQDTRVAAAAASGAILVLGLAPLLLYHRAKGARIAAQATRARLLDALRAEPGLSPAEVARAVGVDPSTALYHLRRLEKEALVGVERDARGAYYFVAGAVPPAERARIVAERKVAPVLHALRTEPGLSKARLAERLAIARPTLAWHLARLQRAGLVRYERDGREVKVYPAPRQETFS